MPNQKERNLLLAEHCIVKLREEFPLGGLNQVNVFQTMMVSDYLLQVKLL